jgi:hypothetical protein
MSTETDKKIAYEYRTPSDTKHAYITICARGGKKAESYNTYKPQITTKYYQTNSTYNCANGW